MKTGKHSEKYLDQISHKRIDPPALDAQTSLPRLIEEAFLSYNAGRLREACRLFTTKMLAPDVTIGLSLSGALTPAGLGASCLVPLVEAGFVDWIVSTGANLYHDTHFALGMEMHQSRPGLDDLKLRENQVIRIYDIVFDYENLLGTDKFYRTLCRSKAFQETLGTAEFHHLVGKYLAERERQDGGGEGAKPCHIAPAPPPRLPPSDQDPGEACWPPPIVAGCRCSHRHRAIARSA
jgi:deoxyhypusine synthase